MKKLFISFCVLILVLAAALGGMLFAYTQSEDYTGDKFPENFYINDIDCSNMTYDEARAHLADAWNHKTFHVVSEDGTELASFTNFGCTYNIGPALETVKKDNILLAALNHYSKAKVDAEIKMAIKSCSTAFQNKVMTSKCIDQGEGVYPSQDAYVDTSDPGYPIISEVVGNKIDPEKFFDAVITRISSGVLTMTFNESEYLTPPQITADDETLVKYQKFCQEKLTQQITYEMGDETFTIPSEDLAKMYATDGSGTINEDGIQEYVENMATKYNNVGAKRSFTTFSGKKISIEGGTEGWKIDQKAERKQLKKDLESGENVSRKPEYKQEGYGEYTRTVGDTYIEVNLTKQEVHVWIKGKDKFHCKVVSGDKSKGKSTPEGFWFVKNKLRDVTMKGTNADGTKYEVPAKYWMGITPNGIGFHDSNWRTEFGGDIWKTNGSHGCVNMPKDKIPKMFKVVEVGMPVVMYYEH